MQSISKGLYLGSFVASIVVLWVSLIGGVVLVNADEDAAIAALGMICFGYLVMIFGIVMLMILVYKLWSALQDGPARTTPGKAVGFLFIPLFNFYWVFQAYYGWAVDYQKYLEEKGVQGPAVSKGIVMTACILGICSIIPYLGVLIGLVNLIFLLIFFNQAIDGANAIIAARSGAANPVAV